MPRIVCVGSINMDLAVYGRSLPRRGETVLGERLQRSPGGKGLNQAVAARRLGAEVAFVGNVGRDDDGAALRAFMLKEGLDTSCVAGIEEGSTGTAVILVEARSENMIVVVPGVNMEWRSRPPDEAMIASGDIVLSQFEIPDGAIIAAFERGRRMGARTVFNAAPARPVAADLLHLVDVLVVNETELAQVSGRDFDGDDLAMVEAAAQALAHRGIALVVTLGAAGAMVVDRGHTSRVEGVRVDAVDTAGAGDCFIGALSAALLRGATLEEAAAFGNRAAAVSVTRRGTAIAMPFAHEL